jgi:hypothetical protein
MPNKQFSVGVAETSLTTLPSNGTAGDAIAIPSGFRGPLNVAWQLVPAGGPSAISNALQASLDGTTWVQIDSDTTTAGNLKFVANVAARFLRVYHTSHTGGTGLTAYILIR